MKKELFIETINSIKKQFEHDDKCHEAFSILLNNDYVSGYDNHHLTDAILRILKDDFKDTDNWIEYFIYELEFGDKYKAGCCSYKNGDNIDISNAEKLYDFLISEI